MTEREAFIAALRSVCVHAPANGCAVCGGVFFHWGNLCPKAPEYIAPYVAPRIPAPSTVVRYCFGAVFGLLAFALWGLATVVDVLLERLVEGALWAMLKVWP
jgi:hypothetical protein